MIARYCRIRRVWRTKNFYLPFPTHRARAVYHEPSLSIRAVAYLSKSLSRSSVSTCDLQHIRLDLFNLPTFTHERGPRTAGQVSWKFHTRYVRYQRDRSRGGKWRSRTEVVSSMSSVIKGSQRRKRKGEILRKHREKERERLRSVGWRLDVL